MISKKEELFGKLLERHATELMQEQMHKKQFNELLGHKKI